LFDTLGLFWSRPSEAWARTRESGDIGSPLIFAILVSWVSIILQTVTMRVINLPALPGRWGRFGAAEGHGRPGLVGAIILAPIIVVIGLFIVSLILHVCCLIVGALTDSPPRRSHLRPPPRRDPRRGRELGLVAAAVALICGPGPARQIEPRR
jgi:hypothetical protein